MIFMKIKMFGIIVMVAGTPYTMDECVASLKVLELPAVLEATAECTGDPRRNGELSQEQIKLINAWTAEQEGPRA